MPLTNELRVLQSTSVPKAVQNEIQELILSGAFPAGHKLPEVELAFRLGVSRGPVREAFRGLEEAGLIRLTKNRGVFVREISTAETNEIYEVRAGLDGTVGHLLAPIVTDAQIDELVGLVDTMDAVLARDLVEYIACNLQFHDRIVEMTGNAKLLGIYRRLMNETYLMRRTSIYRGGGRLVSNEEHRQIVRALATRCPEEASRVMRSHVLCGRDRYMASLAGAPASTAPSTSTTSSAPTFAAGGESGTLTTAQMGFDSPERPERA